MTLKLRFALSFLLNTLLVVGMFGGAYYVLERRAAIERQKQEQIQTVEKIASVCRAMVLSSNGTVALNYLSVLKREPAVVSAACIDPLGRVQAHCDSKWIGRRISDPEELKALTTRSLERRKRRGALEWTMPVVIGVDTISVAQVSYDEGVLKDDIQKKLLATLGQLMAVALGTFFFAVFIGLIMAWSLSHPISLLEEAAHAFGEGRLDYQTPIAGRSDELGRLARAMTAMAQKLKELGALKDEFVALVSHDLRGPLAGISMYVDHLQEGSPGPVNAAQDKILRIIDINTKRLSAFINNILDTTKIRAGRMEYRREPRDLDALAREIVTLLELLMTDKEIHFSYEAEANLPWVQADGQMIHQLLTNLLSNAIKFTPRKGQISLRLKKTSDAMVWACVKDTGPGIAAEELPKLFKKFGQARAPERGDDVRHGTGLGLMIAKDVVDAHGGKIWVESKVGAGSAFYFTLPQASGDIQSLKP